MLSVLNETSGAVAWEVTYMDALVLLVIYAPDLIVVNVRSYKNWQCFNDTP